MKFSAFWDSVTRVCVVLAEEPTPSGAGFALCERAPKGRLKVLATSDAWADSRYSPAKAMMCCARVGLGVVEFELVDLANVDLTLGRFRLADSPLTEAPWRIALRYGDGVDDAPVLVTRLGARSAVPEMIKRFKSRKSDASGVGWMIASRMVGEDIDAPVVEIGRAHV